MSIVTPFSKSVMKSVLTFVVALGGTYGGYQVYKGSDLSLIGFDRRYHTVSEVVDGDTIIVDEKTTVRLLGIDAPEAGTCYGDEATERLAGMVLGMEVFLEKDQTTKDRYDRLLRYVVLHIDNADSDDVFVNKELIAGGFAKHMKMTGNKRYRTEFGIAQKSAKDSGAGLWGECDYAEDEYSSGEVELDVATFNDECIIKGNLNRDNERVYFLPRCPNYNRVKVDPRRGEGWYCSEKDAEKAGFEFSLSCKNSSQFKNYSPRD